MENNTNEQFVDYYQVLRIWPTASDEAIKKAYFNLAKLYHPDVVSKGGKGKDESVDFKLINEAYAVLSDPAKRRLHDEVLKTQGRKAQGTTRESDKRSAQLAYEQARTAMRHNRYDKAVVLLKSAIKYDRTNPAYYSWFGFALAALNTRLHDARDACKKALEMEFYNADYHANLGFVYFQAGLKSTAIGCFREALKWDPEHRLARKYLQDTDAKGSKGSFFKGILSTVFGGVKKTSPSRS